MALIRLSTARGGTKHDLLLLPSPSSELHSQSHLNVPVAPSRFCILYVHCISCLRDCCPPGCGTNGVHSRHAGRVEGRPPPQTGPRRSGAHDAPPAGHGEVGSEMQVWLNVRKIERSEVGRVG